MDTLKDELVGYLLDGKIYDLHQETKGGHPICTHSIFGLGLVRHSCAHILAYALKKLYRTVFLANGPCTDNGFFHDFQLLDSSGHLITVSTHDLPKIEEIMKQIIKENHSFSKKAIPREEFLTKNTDAFKTQMLQENIFDQDVGTYTVGDFTTLCKGPHVRNTLQIGTCFKLLSVSEVSWKNHRIQRIEGVCFATTQDLEHYEKNKELMEKNDHRKIGKSMDLFSFSPLSPGCAFWHPKGLVLIEKIKEVVRKIGYKRFKEYETPVLLKKELWEKTGHLDNYKENMFLLEDLCMKPMNCPCHILLFKEQNFSYKNLPFRIAEFGSCFRNEDQGGVIGLKRVRKMTQDDGHVFCTLAQIESEIQSFLEEAEELYRTFGLERIFFKVATRPAKSIGNPEWWTQAEIFLKNALASRQFLVAEGEGAFYGPKIEIHFKDNFGRLWQCGTIQIDFFLAQRLEAEFTTASGTKDTPIILHRAILGSLERFLAILLENGPLPLWLQPTQVVILPISEKFHDYAQTVLDQLLEHGVRAVLDYSDDTLGKKIKKTIEEKVEITIVVGEQEVRQKNITFRYKNENKSVMVTEFLSLFFIGMLKNANKSVSFQKID